MFHHLIFLVKIVDSSPMENFVHNVEQSCPVNVTYTRKTIFLDWKRNQIDKQIQVP